MIRFENLHKSYGEQHVLKGINLTLQNNGITAILGPNGSGKTTLIKCLLGLVFPDQGVVYMNGEKLQNSHLYRAKLSHLPQVSRFPDNLKVKELFQLVKDIRQKKVDENALLNTFDLQKLLDKKMVQLSGGERQKINLCLTLMFDSPVVVLDEPSVGLDPLALVHLKNDLMAKKAEGKLILFTTHIMPLVEELADHVIFILEGKIYFNGLLSDLLEAHSGLSLEKAIAQILKKTN